MNLVTTERTPSSADRPRAVLPPARAYCRKHTFAPFFPNVSPGTQVQGCSPSSRHVSYDLPPSLRWNARWALLRPGDWAVPLCGPRGAADARGLRLRRGRSRKWYRPGGERGVPRNAVKLFCNLGLSIALCLPTVNQGYDRNPQPTHMPEFVGPRAETGARGPEGRPWPLQVWLHRTVAMVQPAH